MDSMKAQSSDRLNTLKLRLTITAWALCWFKRSLSVFKRFENTSVLVAVDGLRLIAPSLDCLNTLNFSGVEHGLLGCE